MLYTFLCLIPKIANMERDPFAFTAIVELYTVLKHPKYFDKIDRVRLWEVRAGFTCFELAPHECWVHARVSNRTHVEEDGSQRSGKKKK